MNSDAVISQCGQYRYVLTREFPTPGKCREALFIMLNPSTADEMLDDPTIRRCLGFAKREGCTRLTVINLFALRATDPGELKRHTDPEGPDNDVYLEGAVEHHQEAGGLIIAAWGAHPFARRRAEYVMNRIGPVQCLGTTVSGAPKHPLYLPNDAELKRYAGHPLDQTRHS